MNEQMLHTIHSYFANQPVQRAWLFGSYARGEEREDSDYGLLILLDKEKVACKDYDSYMIPLSDLGVSVGEDVRAHLYTQSDWSSWSCAPFNMNVAEDEMVLIAGRVKDANNG